MESKWEKLIKFLGFDSGQAPASPSSNAVGRFSDAVFPSASSSPALPRSGSRSVTPTQSTPGLLASKSVARSSNIRTCAICLGSMQPGQDNAIFTGECSHSFHFHCITSSFNHGNQVCPVCRMKWNQIPFQSSINELPNAARRVGSPPWFVSTFQSLTCNGFEPMIFNDDEAINKQLEIVDGSVRKLEVKTFAQVSAVAKSSSFENFSVVVHIKAIRSIERMNTSGNRATPLSLSGHARTPIDLVTVLDVSGSMAGTKLALLKRAMGFVINNLGPSDRLSVISFSSSARRLFPLRLMTDIGRQQALQAVNSLISNGGTNIAEGLKKGSKVFVDRTWKNPVGSIILLSDGRDNYTAPCYSGGGLAVDHNSILSSLIGASDSSGLRIPVHTFGFGPDHDAALMHSISETSRGTFSFIETEHVIQDAFAQCIGGLLSVVVQELRLGVECVHESLRVGSIKAGSYQTSLSQNARSAYIFVGDLYADEERDFLVTVDIPVDQSSDEMSLLKVSYDFRDPITRELVSSAPAPASEVKIERPDVVGKQVWSPEVERQRNRFTAATAMAEARNAGELGDLGRAASVLESCRVTLSESPSGKTEDPFCVSLCRELQEMKERMANQRVYESAGRAYVLSGLSSHASQRATSRGIHGDGRGPLYQTPCMAAMVHRSHDAIGQSPGSSLQTARSSSTKIQPQWTESVSGIGNQSPESCSSEVNRVES